LRGKITIEAPVKFGMVGFGQRYELISVSKKNAQLTINGVLIIKGHVQFGIDYFVYIQKNAVLQMGHLSSLGGSGKIICTDHICLGDYARIGYESQLIDTSFHKMKDLITGEVSSLSAPIKIGDYNYVGGRVTILKHTKTPNRFTITSNSLCNKDYSILGENTMIGGFPAKLIKDNIVRDWDNENLESFLII
jgi:acetyltransferase-like isoleucine patch superfamily enzyme